MKRIFIDYNLKIYCLKYNVNVINFDFKKNMKSKIVIIFRISFKKQFYVLFLKTVV